MKSAPPNSAGTPTYKRRHRREPARCLVWLEPQDQAHTHGEVARSVDMSPGGAGLVLTRHIPPRSRVMVDLLMLPLQLRLRAHGEVVHSEPLGALEHRVGIRFDAPPVLVSSFTTVEEGT